MQLNKETWLRLRTSMSGAWRRLPRLLLVERATMLRLSILIAWVILLIYLVLQIIFLDPHSSERDRQTPRLDTDQVDELEYWLEERQGEREKEVFGRTESYFNR